ncbi:hypothetical protein [Atlantibacter hermannii]|uniref:hypothetical protein n=1 Tax=Atlantibacter hermannii TaxID=565 RepID=UPI00289732D2|nr:hypothetical protein [Atlantibacter hermannii]
MCTPRTFYPLPMLIKHTQPSGQDKLYPVLVSDVIDADGTRYARYMNGAEVRMSELRFIQLEFAQADLPNLAATPLPEEVIKRDMLH